MWKLIGREFKGHPYKIILETANDEEAGGFGFGWFMKDCSNRVVKYYLDDELVCTDKPTRSTLGLVNIDEVV